MATTGHESEVIDVQGLASAMAKAMNLGISNKGTCSTAADTATKTVQTGDGFALAADAMVIVTFENAVSTSGATLNVNSTSAKPIYYRGAELGANIVKAGDTLILRYNGTRFDIIGTLDTDTNTMTDVAYDTTNKKLQKTVAGVTSDVVTAADIVKDGNAMLIAGYKWTGGTPQQKKDLNTLTGVGVYADYSEFVTNKPINSNSYKFRLIVEKSENSESSLRQVYQGSDERNVYERSSTDYGLTWSAWKLVQADLSNYASASSLSSYLPLAGGTMANTNVVSNLNADLLDGMHSSDFCGKFSKTVSAGAGVRITFTDECSAIIFGRGTSAIATRIVIIGNAYNTYSQWRCLEKGENVTWCKVADSRNIELMNNSSGSLYISVLMGRGTVTFTDITELSGTAVTDVMAMTSDLAGYLPLAGGTMANTNLVTNLNADQLDGLHASDFSRVHTYSIAIGKVAKITFGASYSAIVTGSYADSSNQRIMLMGVGYGSAATASRNRWLCLDCSSVYSWAKSTTEGRTIEIKNGSAQAVCRITVLEMNGASVTFTELDDFSQDASVITDKVAMLSSDITGNAATATALQTSRTIWGQSFDGSGDVSGDVYMANNEHIYFKDTPSEGTASDKEVLRLSNQNNVLLGYGMRTYDGSATYIHGGTGGIQLRTNGTTARMFIDASGNVGIGTTSPTSKLHVAGDATMTGVLTSDRQRVGVYSATVTATSLTLRSDRPGTTIYTLSKNVSSVSINSTYTDFAAGERIIWILTATAQRTVSIASSETIVTPTGSTLTLTIPANGFVAVLFIYDGSKFFVRPLVDNTVMVMQQTT